MPEKRKRGRPRTDGRLDVWFGVQDARERKRIQDRLAQRARRERTVGRTQTAQGKDPGNESALEASGPSPSNVIVHDVAVRLQARTRTPSLDLQNTNQTSNMVLASPPGVQSHTLHHQQFALSGDHFSLCWPAWPIYSALYKHGLMQGSGEGCRTSSDQITSSRSGVSLPEFLQPTPLQLTIQHTRWIDRFPFPRMRDNLILLNEVVDLDEFVRDLFGMASLLLRPNWQGPTWDPRTWIMGPEFASKWAYIFL